MRDKELQFGLYCYDIVMTYILLQQIILISLTCSLGIVGVGLWGKAYSMVCMIKRKILRQHFGKTCDVQYIEILMEYDRYLRTLYENITEAYD